VQIPRCFMVSLLVLPLLTLLISAQNCIIIDLEPGFAFSTARKTICIDKKVYVYPSLRGHLTRVDLVSMDILDIDLTKQTHSDFYLPKDFTITADESIIFTGTTVKPEGDTRPFTYLLAYNSNGKTEGFREIQLLSPQKIAADAEGNIYILGVGLKTDPALLSAAGLSSPSGNEILYRFTRDGQFLGFEAALELSLTPAERRALTGRLSTTPFGVDTKGNKVFQLNRSNLNVVSKAGEMSTIPIPGVEGEDQLLLSVDPNPYSGFILTFLSGKNLEPNMNLRKEGAFQYMNPTHRRLHFDADTKVFRELEAIAGPGSPFRKFELTDGTQVQLTLNKAETRLTITF
jgi:hypothetical protein